MAQKILDSITSRRSVRKFQTDDIPENDIEKIIETGISAPSAGNRQPWRVVVTKDPIIKEKLKEGALGQNFIAQAPVVLIVCMVPEESAERYGERGRSLYAYQDTAAMTQNILLAAHAMGYGACWVGAFNDDVISTVLNVPPGVRPVSIVPIGKIAGSYPEKRKRHSLEDIVIKEKF
jgi:nitroreductase